MTELVVVEKPEQVLLTEVNTQSVVNTTNYGNILTENTVIEPVVTSTTSVLVHGEEVKQTVVQGGVQGPPGVPGASNQFEYAVAGQVLGGNRAVTTNSSGQLVYPDLALESSRVYGITTHSAVQGELVEVQITGTQTEPSWSWNVNLPVFVGLNGTLTQTIPTTGQVLAVGYPQSPVKLFIDRQPPIYMG